MRGDAAFSRDFHVESFPAAWYNGCAAFVRRCVRGGCPASAGNACRAFHCAGLLAVLFIVLLDDLVPERHDALAVVSVAGHRVDERQAKLKDFKFSEGQGDVLHGVLSSHFWLYVCLICDTMIRPQEDLAFFFWWFRRSVCPRWAAFVYLPAGALALAVIT